MTPSLIECQPMKQSQAISHTTQPQEKAQYQTITNLIAHTGVSYL